MKCLLWILIFFILRGNLFPQENVVNNLSAIDKLIDESFTPLNNKFLLLGRENFFELVIDGKREEHFYILNSIKRKFNDYKLIIGEDSDSIDYKLLLRNLNIKIIYPKIFTDDFFGTKKVEREVLVSYDLDLIDKENSSIIYHHNYRKKFKDNFDLDKLDLVEDKRYLFSQSILPEESSLNQLIYPAIIILSSAAAIILFFIIRSK